MRKIIVRHHLYSGTVTARKTTFIQGTLMFVRSVKQNEKINQTQEFQRSSTSHNLQATANLIHTHFLHSFKMVLYGTAIE